MELLLIALSTLIAICAVIGIEYATTKVGTTYRAYHVVDGKKFYTTTRIDNVMLVLLSRLFVYGITLISVVGITYLLHMHGGEGGVILASAAMLSSTAKITNHFQIVAEEKFGKIKYERGWVPARQMVVKHWGIESIIFNTNVQGHIDTAIRGDMDPYLFPELVGKVAVYGYSKAGYAIFIFSDRGKTFMEGIDNIGLSYDANSLPVLFKRVKRLISPHMAMKFDTSAITVHEEHGILTEGNGWISLSDARRLMVGTAHFKRVIVGAILRLTIVEGGFFAKNNSVVVPDGHFTCSHIAYETKKELKSDTNIIGVLGFADGKETVNTDPQSVVNFKLHKFFYNFAMQYAVELRDNLLNEEYIKEKMNIYGAIVSDESRLSSHRLLHALSEHVGWIFTIPYFIRSTYNLFMKVYSDITRHKVPMPSDVARSGYLIPDPTAFDEDGRYIGCGVLQPGEVFISGDISNQEIVLHRNPNDVGEFNIVQHKIVTELLPLSGNAVFYCAEPTWAKEFMWRMGTADNDDRVVIYLCHKIVAHFKTLTMKAIVYSKGEPKSNASVEFTPKTFVEEAEKQILIHDPLGMIMNTLIVAAAVDDKSFKGIEQGNIIDDIVKFGHSMHKSEIMIMVWNFWKRLNVIKEHTLDRMPGNILFTEYGVNYKMSLKINKKSMCIEKGGYTEVTRSIYTLKWATADGQRHMQQELFERNTITILHHGIFTTLMNKLSGILGDIELIKIEGQKANRVPLSVKTIPTEAHHNIAYGKIAMVWKYWMVDKKLSNPGESDEERKEREALGNQEVAMMLSKYSSLECTYIAARAYKKAYFNKDIKPEDLDSIDAGLRNYPDGLAWTRDVVINSAEGESVLHGMSYYTLQAFRMIEGGYSYKQVKITDKAYRDTNTTLPVKVSGNKARYSGSIIGNTKCLSGSYNMVIKNGIGFIQMPLIGHVGLPKVSPMINIVFGWKSKIEAGTASNKELESWKEMMVGKIIDLEEYGTGKLSAWKMSTYKPRYRVKLKGDIVGNVADTTTMHITGQQHAKILVAHNYSLVAQLM